MTPKSRTLLWTAALVMVAIIGMVVWGCPGEVVRGAEPVQSQQAARNPFDSAFSRFEERFRTTVKRAVDPLGTVTPQTRESFLDIAVKEATFVRVTAEGATIPTTLSADQLAFYREYVDGLLEVGDVLFKVTWTLRERTFSNTGIASSDLQPKLGPILSTLAYRSARGSSVAAIVGPRAAAVLMSFMPHNSPVQPTSVGSRDEWTLFNMFNVRVAWATLEIIQLGTTLTPDVRLGWRPLWTVSNDAPKSAPTRRGRCLDVAVKTIWSSFVVNLKLTAGSNVEFGAEQGLFLHRGDEPLRARRCR